MKPGDLVRFHQWSDLSDISDWSNVPKSKIGVLVHHDKLMGQVEILYQGVVIKERASFVEKAGRRDIRSDDDLPN